MRLFDDMGAIPEDALHKTTQTVDTIADRDALAADLEKGDVIVVLDASDDPTVDSGTAAYVWDGIAFSKLSEAESMDLVMHTHGQPLADIDDAALKRHQHGQPLADIDDAALKRHEHGQPLADIDDAALKRHEHQDSDTAIHLAVVQTHTHAKPDSEISDAVDKRHEHGRPLADIDDAVDKRHEHTNKVVLDKFAEEWPSTIYHSLTWDDRVIPRMVEGDISIYVAPDSASRQTGDWPTTGAAGIREAMHWLAAHRNDSYKKKYVYLRSGTYTIDTPIRPAGGRGDGRVILRSVNAPAWPGVGDFAWNDFSADADVLRSAATVIFDVSGIWCGAYAADGEFLHLENILFDHGSTTTHDTLVADRHAFIRADKCAAVSTRCFMRAYNHSGILSYYGAPVLAADGGRYGHASDSSLVYSRGYTNYPVIGGYGSWGATADRHSALVFSGRDPDKIFWRNVEYDAFYIRRNSVVYTYQMDVDGCRRAVNGGWSGHAEINTVKIRNNTSDALYFESNFNAIVRNIDVDPNGSSTNKRFYLNRNCRAYSGGGHSNSPNYSPAFNTDGNDGSKWYGTQ